MLRHPSLPTAILLSLLALAGGCAAVEKPTASVRGMDVTDVTPRGFTMNVDLDVHNPNSVAIPLTNADYSLSLGGVGVIESTKVHPDARIPANGTGRVTLPVPVTFENLLSASRGIRQGGGKVSYGFDAGLNFDTGLPVIGVQRVPIRHEGTLDVRELLSRNWGTILTSPAAKELAQQVLGGAFRF
jgi:LEA14-like dessication related protein